MGVAGPDEPSPSRQTGHLHLEGLRVAEHLGAGVAGQNQLSIEGVGGPQQSTHREYNGVGSRTGSSHFGAFFPRVPPDDGSLTIYDEEGQPVWYYVSGSQPDNGGAIDVEPTDQGVLIGPSWNGQLANAEPPREVDWAGNILWECGASICGAGESISHHAGKLSNGDYVVIQDITTNGGFV